MTLKVLIWGDPFRELLKWSSRVVFRLFLLIKLTKILTNSPGPICLPPFSTEDLNSLCVLVG